MPSLPALDWWIVIPVKGTDLGKSRLAADWPGDIRTLARAFALDVIEAASSAETVAGVVVVTTAEEAEQLRRGLGDETADAVRFAPDPGAGLNAAVAAGVAFATTAGDTSVAALLGDLPGLRAEDLATALHAADAAASFLPDQQGTGTTLVTARSGVPFRSAFGAGSAQRHRELGLHEIQRDLPGIRHDVDTLTDLRALTEVGRHTRALLLAAHEE